MRYFVYIIIAVVAVTVIAGFFVAGSPQEERLHRFDEQRISDLQFLQAEIINFWQRKARLPSDLSEIEDSIRGVFTPLDPETAAPYEYNVIDEEALKFELCTVFSLPSLEEETLAKPVPVRAPESAFYGQNWQHDLGRTCFERAIDEDLYKPLFESVR